MALKMTQLTLNRDSMPQHCKELGISVVRQSVVDLKGNAKGMVLLRPAAQLLDEEDSVGPEPRFYFLLCGLQLKARNGSAANGSGQLVITGRRILGMITKGTAGSKPFSLDETGDVFCFSINRSDVYAPQVKRRRLLPSDFSFRAKEESPIAFGLMVFSCMVNIVNSQMSYCDDRAIMNRAFSAEGEERLLRP